MQEQQFLNTEIINHILKSKGKSLHSEQNNFGFKLRLFFTFLLLPFLEMPTQYYLFLSLALFCIGVMGTLMRRNAIIIFMCIELMLNAVNLLLVAFSKMYNNSDAQIMVFFIMVVAAAEVAVGLAIIVMMYRKVHSVDVNILNRLKH